MKIKNIKIKPELAVGIILAVAIIVSGVLLFINKSQTDSMIKSTENMASQSLIVRKKGDANKEVLFATCGEKDIYKKIKGEKFSVTIDGKESPDYDCLSTPAFSQDCQQFAYSACADGKVFVVVNGTALASSYDSISEIVFSPDGKKMAYVAGKNEKYVVVLNGQEGKEYQEISVLQTETRSASIIFTPDSQQIIYAVTDNSGTFMVVNGAEGKRYSSITNVYFSDDGTQFAYDATSGNKKVTVVNNKEVVGASNTSSNSSTSQSAGYSAGYSSDNNSNYYKNKAKDIFLNPNRLQIPICQSGDGGCNF